MLPSALFGLCLAQLAFAKNLGAQVNLGVLKVQNFTAALGNDTVTFNGSLPFALQIQIDGVIVHKQIRKAIADSIASDPFGGDNSYAIALTLLNINETVQNSLQAIKAKKALFGELSPIVLASLYQLKNDTDALGAAIVPKLVEELQDLAPLVQDPLDDGFNDAIVYYGGTSSARPTTTSTTTSTAAATTTA